MMRFLAAILILLCSPAFADGPTPGPGVGRINGKQGYSINLVAPDVGAVACPGTCAQHGAFVTALATVQGSTAAAITSDLNTGISDGPGGPISLEWRADQIKAGGPVATFVQSRYSLNDTQMDQVFSLAQAAVTNSGKLIEMVTPTPAQIGAVSRSEIAPVALSGSASDITIGNLNSSLLTPLGGGFVDLSSQASGFLPPHLAPDLAPKSSPSFTGLSGFGVPAGQQTDVVDINAGTFRLRAPFTPASSSAPCFAGEISWDASFIYVCIHANTWTRATLAGF